MARGPIVAMIGAMGSRAPTGIRAAVATCGSSAGKPTAGEMLRIKEAYRQARDRPDRNRKLMIGDTRISFLACRSARLTRPRLPCRRLPCREATRGDRLASPPFFWLAVRARLTRPRLPCRRLPCQSAVRGDWLPVSRPQATLPMSHSRRSADPSPSYPIGILPPNARISLPRPPALDIDFIIFCICR